MGGQKGEKEYQSAVDYGVVWGDGVAVFSRILNGRMAVEKCEIG